MARQIRLRRLSARPRSRSTLESPHTAHSLLTTLPLPRSPFPRISSSSHLLISTHLRSTSSWRPDLAALSPDHHLTRHSHAPFSLMSECTSASLIVLPESYNSLRIPGPACASTSGTMAAAQAQAQCLTSTLRFANATAITRGSGIPFSTYASHSSLGKTAMMRFTRALSTCAAAA